MAKVMKIMEKMKKQPLALGITLAIILLVGITAFSGSKPEYYEKGGVISNVSSQQPAEAAKQAEKLLEDSQSGIVSFEMYVPQKKAKAQASLSREQLIQRIIEMVANIKDDLKAQNAIINQITSLDFKVGGSELVSILKSAEISDPFYYTNTVKRLAPILEYPMSERHMKQIVEPITDVDYRHKLYDVLVREQSRHK